MDETRITRKGPDYIEFDRAPITDEERISVVEDAILTAAKREYIWLLIERHTLCEVRRELMLGLKKKPTARQSEERRKARAELRTALGFDDDGEGEER